MSQSKIAPYLLYAIGEIMLVVIGILIAVQIDDYREMASKKEREVNILNNLNKEFEYNLSQLNKIEEGHRINYRSTVWLINHWPNYRQQPADTVKKHLSAMMGAFTFNPSQTAVRTLINTSSFDLIQEEQLKQKLISWTDVFDDYAEEEKQSNNGFYNQLIPYLNKNADLDNFLPTPNSVPLYYKPIEALEFKNLLKGRKIGFELILNQDDLANLKRNIEDILQLTSK